MGFSSVTRSCIFLAIFLTSSKQSYANRQSRKVLPTGLKVNVCSEIAKLPSELYRRRALVLEAKLRKVKSRALICLKVKCCSRKYLNKLSSEYFELRRKVRSADLKYKKRLYKFTEYACYARDDTRVYPLVSALELKRKVESVDLTCKDCIRDFVRKIQINRSMRPWPLRVNRLMKLRDMYPLSDFAKVSSDKGDKTRLLNMLKSQLGVGGKF